MIQKIIKKFNEMPVAVRASTAYVVCNILQKCLSFITLPLFVRILTQEQYGQYTVYTSWSAILTIFITLNLSYGSFNTAMVRFEKDRMGYISSIQSICVLLGLLFLAIYWPFRQYLNALFELPTTLVFLLVAEIIAQFALNCWFTLKHFNYQYKGVVAVTMLVAVSSPVLAYLLVSANDEKGYARIFGYALVNIVVGMTLFVSNAVKGKKIFSKEYWSYALKFNLPLITYYLSQVVFNQSDRIMISHISGTDKAAMYGVAYALATILTFVLNSINSSYVPWFYSKIKEGREADNRSVSNGIAILMAFMLLGIIALAPEIISIMSGPEYAEAVWVVPPVTMSLLLLFYSQLFINMEFYYEEKTMLVWGSIGSAILNIVLNWLLIPVYGFVAAGYTTLVSYIAFAVANYFTLRIVLRRNGSRAEAFDLKALIVIFAVFSALSFAAMALYNQPVIRYMIIVAVLGGMIIKYKAVIAFVKKTIIRK